MQDNYTTQRLQLTKLVIEDADLILELVNTPGWLRFIGDRNIRTLEDARLYIQKILANSGIRYWVVKVKDKQTPVGIVTFIQRDYLDHPDIGFAFLPIYARQGYAFEATKTVLIDLLMDPAYTTILATTIKENVNSIRLLEKLGLRYYKEIQVDNEMLGVYSISADKLMIDQLTWSFFSLFTNSKQRKPGWNTIHSICIPETLIIKKSRETETVYNLNSFIEPRKKLLSDGTLTEFEETETFEETAIAGKLAQRYSRYLKKGYMNGKYFEEYGTKFFQFIKTSNGWKINSLVWEDDND